MRKLVTALALVVATGSAAQAPPDCGQPETLSNADARACMRREMEAADRDLATAHAALVAALNRGERTLLAASRRAWEAWRKSECDFETQAIAGIARTGSEYALAWAACHARLSHERASELGKRLAERERRAR